MSFIFKNPVDIQYIANYLQNDILRLVGDLDNKITGVSSIEAANVCELTFCSSKDKEGALKISKSKASAIFCYENTLRYLPVTFSKVTYLIVSNPMLQFNRIIKHLFELNYRNANSEPTQSIKNCKIHESVIFEKNGITGDNVEIGAETLIGSCTVIYDGVKIGNNVTIGPNCSIGIDGLAYAKNEENEYEKFIHLGNVIIEDNVDIGANSCIVRGTLQNTIIKKGTKIGNLVNIGHNVKVGSNCFISAGAVLCGSVHVEDDCWIAPHASILNHVRVGSAATVGLGAVVTKNIAANTVVVGNPAKPIKR